MKKDDFFRMLVDEINYPFEQLEERHAEIFEKLKPVSADSFQSNCNESNVITGASFFNKKKSSMTVSDAVFEFKKDHDAFLLKIDQVCGKYSLTPGQVKNIERYKRYVIDKFNTCLNQLEEIAQSKPHVISTVRAQVQIIRENFITKGAPLLPYQGVEKAMDPMICENITSEPDMIAEYISRM